jgi:hypothetical protein
MEEAALTMDKDILYELLEATLAGGESVNGC